MNKRVLLAGVFGGIAMFAWSFIAHMALPLGEAGVKQMDGEQALLSSMQTTLTAPGLYLFPHMPADNDQAAYQQKIASGPSGMLVYLPHRDFSFPKALGIEFGTELVLAILATYVLSLTSLGTFGARLGLFAVVGALAVMATNVSYWNWYAFPGLYTAGTMLTQWVAFLCAGLVAAAMKVGRTRYAPAVSAASAAA